MQDFHDKKNAYTCAEGVKFPYEDFNDENLPLLITYTYDSRVEHVDYSAIAKKVRSSTPTIAAPAVNRRKRTAGALGECQVQNLTIFTHEIFPGIVTTNEDESIVFPSSYDAGICGGYCDFLGPETTTHAPFVHLLINILEVFAPSHRHPEYNFMKCCAPVSYLPLKVMVTTPPYEATMIRVVDDMIIDKCECLDIIV